MPGHDPIKPACVPYILLVKWWYYNPGMIQSLRPANERRRYKVTPSHNGWARTQNQSREEISSETAFLAYFQS